jgi:alpha-mannosidase
MRAMSIPIESGSLGISGSFIIHEPAAFTITAIKTAEDGNGLIVRGHNASAAPVRVNLMPWRVFKNAIQCNLKEDTLTLLTPAADGSITFPARPHEIVTVRFSDL